MKYKIYTFLFIFILTFGFLQINTKAYEIGGVEYGYWTKQLYTTQNDENYYNITFYLENGSSDIPLNAGNQTTWYNAFDNINGQDHVYNIGEPMAITYVGSGVVFDGVYLLYFDYDLAGASSSKIYFLDNYNSQVGMIYMSELDGDFDFILIQSAILDPYGQGYADGSREKGIEKDNYYLPKIESLESLVEYTEETFYNNGYTDGYSDGRDYESSIAYNQGELHTADYIFQHGIESYGYDYQSAYDYNLGFNAGELSNFNGFTVLINAFFQTFQILTIELLPGITLGAIAFIPLMLGLITFAVGLATASFSGNQYSKGAKKGGRKK